MTRFKFFTYLMPLAIAGGLALGLSAAPAEAHCARKHTGDHAHCTSDNTGREDTVPASSGFDNDEFDDIFSDCTKGVVSGGVKTDQDGNRCYEAGEDRVKSTLGGQRPARFFLRSPKSSGKNVGREITLDLSGCAIGDGFGCGPLKDILGLANVAALNNVNIEGFVLVVRPYATTMKCPEEAEPCGEINVFTMDPIEAEPPGDPVPMGLWIWMGESHLQLEFASQIDPRSSIDPGRGLEVCEAEDKEVGTLDDVMVTASESSAFGLPPDQNNSWEVQVAEGSALVYLTGQDQECVAKINGMSFLMRIERRE